MLNAPDIDSTKVAKAFVSMCFIRIAYNFNAGETDILFKEVSIKSGLSIDTSNLISVWQFWDWFCDLAEVHGAARR